MVGVFGGIVVVEDVEDVVEEVAVVVVDCPMVVVEDVDDVVDVVVGGPLQSTWKDLSQPKLLPKQFAEL